MEVKYMINLSWVLGTFCCRRLFEVTTDHKHAAENQDISNLAPGWWIISFYMNIVQLRQTKLHQNECFSVNHSSWRLTGYSDILFITSEERKIIDNIQVLW